MLAITRVATSARVAFDEFDFECACCPFARLADRLLGASDWELFYWFDYTPSSEWDDEIVSTMLW